MGENVDFSPKYVRPSIISSLSNNDNEIRGGSSSFSLSVMKEEKEENDRPAPKPEGTETLELTMSERHALGTCAACFFNHTKKGCASGKDCLFCHECPKEVLSAARKNKLKLTKQLKRQNKGAAEEWNNKKREFGAYNVSYQC